MLSLLFTAFVLTFVSVFAVSNAPVPITSDNITDLRPVTWVAFDALPTDVVIETGWFTLSVDGVYLASVNAAEAGGMVIWDSTGTMIDRFTFELSSDSEFPPTILDAQFGSMGDGHTLAVITTADGQHFTAAVHPVGGETVEIPLPSEAGIPVRVWLDATEPYLWLEALAPDPDDSYQIVRITLDHPADMLILPSAPEHDAASVVRIGRIPAPLAVTAAEDGRVLLWDLQTGAISAEVHLPEIPVFGRVNEAGGRKMAWRDQESQALHLLDFDTGEDRLVAEIGQAYIQALMLTPDGALVLAVHMGDEPTVTAWDAATGERYDLGRYRADCTRVPDMVQLSRDGKTLAIGCDAGLEIWQIAPPP